MASPDKLSLSNSQASASLPLEIKVPQKTHSEEVQLSHSDQAILDYKKQLLQNLQFCDDGEAVIVESKNKSLMMQTRSTRGSKYRGVSKNGNKWQVMIVRGKFKKYIGAIESEDVAGVLYDKYSLIIQGLQVSLISSSLLILTLFSL